MTVLYCSLSFHMLSVMRGMALAPPYLASFNYLSPLPVASLGGSPPFFHLVSRLRRDTGSRLRRESPKLSHCLSLVLGSNARAPLALMSARSSELAVEKSASRMEHLR